MGKEPTFPVIREVKFQEMLVEIVDLIIRLENEKTKGSAIKEMNYLTDSLYCDDKRTLYKAYFEYVISAYFNMEDDPTGVYQQFINLNHLELENGN